LSNNPRQATIKADTAGLLFYLDRETFRYTLANTSAAKATMITNALSKVPLLANLTSDQISRISEAVELVKYQEGQVWYILCMIHLDNVLQLCVF
jgi:CRP-like cAMP-binding protein